MGEVFQKKHWETALPYYLILPVVVLIVGLVGYPFGNVVWLSLNEKFIGGTARFIGLGNYIDLFRTVEFINSIKVSFIYTGSNLALQFGLGLALALALNQKWRIQNLLQALIIIPWVLPPIATALGWLWMYDDLVGVLNFILTRLKIIPFGVSWLGDPKLALFSVVVAHAWLNTPFVGVSLFAGLQTVPQSLYDAASIDGGNRVQKLIHISLPHIKDLVMILVFIQTIQIITTFQYVYILTQGGPAKATNLFSMYTYTMAFRIGNLGRGIAISMAMFPLLLVLMVVLLRIRKE